MSVKLEDVAQKSGVSKSTASLALNGSTMICEKTRMRVEQAARELGYHPNPYARNLVMRQTRRIGLIIPDIKNYYYASLTQSIFEYLTDMDYTLSVFISHNKPEIEKRNIEAVIEERADALLLIPVNTPNTPDYLDIIKKADIPVLFLTSRYPESDIPCVMCDLYNGIQEMQKCLYSDGKRRMHLLTGKQDVYCLELREQGFTDFIKQNGCEDGRIIRIPDIDYDTTYRYILENGTQGADVILCVNDMMALGVINALRALNLSVPDDVAVTGYDDVIYSVTSPVPITTIRQDIPLLAKTAAEEILKMAKGEYRSHDIPLLPCDIVIRNSAIR